MTCSRCGVEDSMFWYPYAFGMAPIPSVTADRCIDRAQYFTLCDKCQQRFTEFMNNRDWPFYDREKLLKMVDESRPMPIITKEAEE